MNKTLQRFMYLPTSLVVVPEDRQRVALDVLALNELAEDIKLNGQLQPIVVIPNANSDSVTLVAGYRRLTAVKSLGIDVATIVIDDNKTAGELYLMEFAENEFRQSLSWWDRDVAIVKCHALLCGRSLSLDDLKNLSSVKKYWFKIISMENFANRIGIARTTLLASYRRVEFGIHDEAISNAISKNAADAMIDKKLRDVEVRSRLMQERKIVSITEVADSNTSEDDDSLECPKFIMNDDEDKVEEEEEEEAEIGFSITNTPEYKFPMQEIDRRIINADYFEYEKLIAANSVDVVIADPPYGVNKEASFFSGRDATGSASCRTPYRDDEEHFLAFMPKLCQSLYRVMKSEDIGSHGYIFCGDINAHLVVSFLREAGFFARHVYIVWHKVGSHSTENPAIDFGRAHEVIVFFRKGSNKKLNANGIPDVISIPNTIRQNLKHSHMTTKTPAIYAELLKYSAMPNDVVLDPMAGLCPLAVACCTEMAEFKLNWFCIEKEEEFVNEAKVRLLDSIVVAETESACTDDV